MQRSNNQLIVRESAIQSIEDKECDSVETPKASQQLIHQRFEEPNHPPVPHTVEMRK